MQAPALLALALVALVAGAAVWRLWPALPPRGRRALLAGALLGVPLAWLGVLSVAERLLLLVAPVGTPAFVGLLLAGVALFALLQAAALLLPEPRVWAAVAVVPVVAIVIASLEPRTTMGGLLAALLALVLLLAAAILPRGLALAASDRSRAFVALVAALALAMGGAFGAALGTAAVREGGLGLAQAERAWRLEVAPEHDEPYDFLVPFPWADEGGAREVAEAWIAAARIASGEGSLEIIEPGVLRVSGRGPLVAEAAYRFHAPASLRESVAPFVAQDVESLPPEPARPLPVTWAATAAVEGETCAAREVTAVLGPQARLFEGRARVWPEGACALT